MVIIKNINRVNLIKQDKKSELNLNGNNSIN